ncbi:MAG TPA: Sir2 silent information regulator family NAD-dependent deacetylase [Ruminococcaceae bacterium]|nr:Sir2 silent information regulator family NAD-dependent deacetylase [Oscillospiraceae bacterium]
MTYENKISIIKEKIKNADAVIIGAGAGLSTAAGFVYSGERFDRNFSDFGKKYGFKDMYTGGFVMMRYSPEEFWAYWSRNIYVNRYSDPPKDTYKKLLKLVKNKDYFVLTTNVDHCFQKAGFDKRRLFYTQGDYGLFQCSVPCHDKTYDNLQTVKEMLSRQKNMKIPSELVPQCPVCGKPMTLNLRSDDTFVQDEGWYKASERYSDFLRRHEGLNVVFLEIGVGYNTPGIIKIPFMEMTAKNPNAVYICLNYDDDFVPDVIRERSVSLKGDADKLLSDIIN